MHYYQFNIADYRKDTQHLTPMEHYIYRALLDWMYLDEAPITKDTSQILRRLCLSNDRLTDVEQVLYDFFTESEDGYTQDRVLFEISEYRRRIQASSKAGKASAKARKLKRSKASERALNDRTTDPQPTNNQEPITNNQLKDIGQKRKRFVPPTVDEVAEYTSTRAITIDPGRFVDFYASKGWMVGKNKMKDWQAAVRSWEKRENGQSEQAGRKNTRGPEVVTAADLLNEGYVING